MPRSLRWLLIGPLVIAACGGEAFHKSDDGQGGSGAAAGAVTGGVVAGGAIGSGGSAQSGSLGFGGVARGGQTGSGGLSAGGRFQSGGSGTGGSTDSSCPARMPNGMCSSASTMKCTYNGMNQCLCKRTNAVSCPSIDPNCPNQGTGGVSALPAPPPGASSGIAAPIAPVRTCSCQDGNWLCILG